jgi:hypothetical protein
MFKTTFMKTFFLFTGIFFATFLSAQDKFELKTISQKGHKSIGGYGTVTNEVTEIANKSYYSLGAYGGVLLNHKVLLGGLGKVVFTGRTNTQYNQSTFVYFGPYTEYLINPESVFHFSIGVMGGMGIYNSVYGEKSDLIFVTEPKVGVQVNVTNFMRVVGNIGYRYAANNKYESFKKDDFSSLTGGVGLSFGKF